jgi:hypothetical protein
MQIISRLRVKARNDECGFLAFETATLHLIRRFVLSTHRLQISASELVLILFYLCCNSIRFFDEFYLINIVRFEITMIQIVIPRTINFLLSKTIPYT